MSLFLKMWFFIQSPLFVLLLVLIFNLCTVNCWQIQSRIVGGSSAIEKQFPYHVSLRNKRNALHFCGGAILNEKYIITAAHCLIRQQMTTVYGVANITHATDIGVRMEFSRWILHTDFTEETSKSDIALIQSIEQINFSDFIKPINLPIQELSKSGLIAVVSGWGICKVSF